MVKGLYGKNIDKEGTAREGVSTLRRFPQGSIRSSTVVLLDTAQILWGSSVLKSFFFGCVSRMVFERRIPAECYLEVSTILAMWYTVHTTSTSGSCVELETST